MTPTSLDHVRSQWTLGRRPLAVLAAAAGLGLLAALAHAALAEQGYRRFMLAYLVAFAFVLSLSLGGLFFVIIQHLTRAGWSVLVRRPAESLAANMLLVSVLFLPIAFSVLRGGGEIYPWAQASAESKSPRQNSPDRPPHSPLTPQHSALSTQHSALSPHPSGLSTQHSALTPQDSALSTQHSGLSTQHSGLSTQHSGLSTQHSGLSPQHSKPMLNPAWFVGRWAVLLAVWATLGLSFWRLSIRQDATADPAATVRMERLAAPAALLLGLTLTLGAFDLLMSLDPHWYSTIMGIYYFSGAAVGGVAAIILLVLGLQHAGALPRAIGEAHYLDLGRLLFAFLFFWAYIAFSQYMLLWYANIPETTAWLRLRGLTTAAGDANAWSALALVLLFGHFLLPFLGLMSRHIKRRPVLLAAGAGWMLLMHYLDLAWVVLPELGPSLHLGLMEFGLLVAMVSLFTLGLIGRLRPHSLIPVGDPRLRESAAHETVY